MESNKIPPEEREFILIKASSDRLTIHKIFCEDIIAFEAKNNYVKLHLATGSLISYIGISEIEALFIKDSRFLRLHRSYIIAIRHIEFIRSDQVKMRGGLYFAVGELYIGEFKKLVSKHLIKSGKTQ